jgi:hypothetical protein
MRHKTAQENIARAVRRTAGASTSRKIDAIRPIAAAFLLLLMTAPAVLAETAANTADTADTATMVDLDVSTPPAALDSAAGAAGQVADPVLQIPADPTEISPALLEALLTVRSSTVGAPKQLTTDEALAAAVALGTNPDLEPKNPFRKRSRDIFRTERPVSIGKADMLLRLRLRAKARRAMSVELRF